MRTQQDKARLRRAAVLLRDELRVQDEGGLILSQGRIHVRPAWTDGWNARVGSLGRNEAKLELWLDRWPRHSKRHFYFGFFSPQRAAIQKLIRCAPDHLQPKLELTTDDYERIGKTSVWLLKKPLRRQDFNRPIRESYRNRNFFFGMYDPTPPNGSRGDRQVAHQAAAFFLEVIQRASPTRSRDAQLAAPHDFPHVENRRVVRTHLSRERSGILATNCKIRDRYRCQVCRMRFEDVYGDIGQDFAEAHHIIPLSRLKSAVTHTLDDLTTVCSNCHRMLHKMKGEREDLGKLRHILCRSRRKR